MDQTFRITALEEIVSVQAERILQLEALLMSDFQPPLEWRLTRREAQVFGVLLSRPRVTKDVLAALIYTETDTDPTVIESHVSKLRKKVARFGVAIESERYLGYRLIDRERFSKVAA